MLKNILTSGVNDDTLTATFYKLAEENAKLIKNNQLITKERDVALFKLDKLEFENALAPPVPKSDDVRQNYDAKTVDIRRINIKEAFANKNNNECEGTTDKSPDCLQQKNNQELEAKISKVCERMTVINKRLEDGEDEMINFLKQNNARSNNLDIQHMSSSNLLKDQGLNFNKTFFSSIQSKDSHSPVPRLNLSSLKYKEKENELKEYAEKLEESVKLLRRKLKIQIKEFDKLRFKYVKLANQNKMLFNLNEKLK